MWTQANTWNLYRNCRKLLTFFPLSTLSPVLCPPYILWMTKKWGSDFFGFSFILPRFVSPQFSTIMIMSKLATAWGMSPHTFQLRPRRNQDGDMHTCADCTVDMDDFFVFTADHKTSQVLTFVLLKGGGVKKHLPAVSLQIHKFFADWFENPTGIKASILCESFILSKQLH